MSIARTKREQSKFLFEKLKNDPAKLEIAKAKLEEYDACDHIYGKMVEIMDREDNEKNGRQLFMELLKLEIANRKILIEYLEKTLLS
jgi:hypothetical protein